MKIVNERNSSVCLADGGLGGAKQKMHFHRKTRVSTRWGEEEHREYTALHYYNDKPRVYTACSSNRVTSFPSCIGWAATEKSTFCSSPDKKTFGIKVTGNVDN